MSNAIAPRIKTELGPITVLGFGGVNPRIAVIGGDRTALSLAQTQRLILTLEATVSALTAPVYGAADESEPLPFDPFETRR
jgi:hypothetical protein